MSRLQKYLGEASGFKMTFGGVHLQDNILDGITVNELQDTAYSNIPDEKINVRSVTNEFNSILNRKIKDAKFVAKKVIPELAKDLKQMTEEKVSESTDEKKMSVYRQGVYSLRSAFNEFSQYYMKSMGQMMQNKKAMDGKYKKVRESIAIAYEKLDDSISKHSDMIMKDDEKNRFKK